MGIRINEISPTYPWGFSQNNHGGGDTPSPDPPTPPTPPGPDPPTPTTRKIYSIHIDQSNSDPSAAITYGDDAVGMQPAHMVFDAETPYFDYGSWENAFFMPKPCMLNYDGTVAYYLNPNDYTKKVDGTDADTSATAGLNAMMEWPLIWYKFSGGDSESDGYFYVSNEQVDETYHCWCNLDYLGEITPHFYTSIYTCTNPATVKTEKRLRSLSGCSLVSNSSQTGETSRFGYRTMTEELSMVNRLSVGGSSAPEWYPDVYCDRMLINALLLLISKTRDSISAFGFGMALDPSTYRYPYSTGRWNTKGLFYGVSTSCDVVKVFGMENWYGGPIRRIYGAYRTSSGFIVKLTYSTADGSTVEGYKDDATTREGMLVVGSMPATPQSMNLIVSENYTEYGFYPYVIEPITEVVDWQHKYWSSVYNNVGNGSVFATYPQAYFESPETDPYNGRFGQGLFACTLADTSRQSTITTGISCKPLASRFS